MYKHEDYKHCEMIFEREHNRYHIKLNHVWIDNQTFEPRYGFRGTRYYHGQKYGRYFPIRYSVPKEELEKEGFWRRAKEEISIEVDRQEYLIEKLYIKKETSMKNDHKYEELAEKYSTKRIWNESETGAQREGIGLPYFRQVPLEAVAAGAVALEYGAEKYENRNWEKGLPWQQMIDSLKRHIDDFERGEEYDNGTGGSGLPHVCMIMSSAMMLSASVIREIGKDDRLPPTNEAAFSPKEVARWMQTELERGEDWRNSPVEVDRFDITTEVG